MPKPELLAPAGNLEKLKIAIAYGADAVYLGGEQYSLRAGAGNFSLPVLTEAVAFAHERNKKVYVTVNIFAHNRDLVGLPSYLEQLAGLGVDGILISDLGVLDLALNLNLGVDLHLSTQANATNWASVSFWERLGVKRVVLARELSLTEIAEIRARTQVELEAFVHGAMCMSYSGRCLLSSYWTGRSANRGACTHPCRWRYQLVEQTRPGEYMPIEEDERGSYILSSKDLNMIHHIPELAHSGITSWKIEGRMKSIHYVATVVKAYREAIDLYWQNPAGYRFQSRWDDELEKVSDRGFTTGFYFEGAQRGCMVEEDSTTSSPKVAFVGLVLDNHSNGLTLVEQRNRFSVGDWLEVLEPKGHPFVFQLENMYDESGSKIQSAPHPQQKVFIEAPKQIIPNGILRRKIPSA